MSAIQTNRIIAALLFVAIMMIASVPSMGQGRERHTSELICTLSGFFSFESAEVIANSASADGSAILNCKNDRGFSTTYPIHGDITVSVPPGMKLSTAGSEVAFSINTSTFVIPREIGQIQDTYKERPELSRSLDAYDTMYLLRGEREDLVLEIKISTSTLPVKGLEIKSLTLRIDESAPDIF